MNQQLDRMFTLDRCAVGEVAGAELVWYPPIMALQARLERFTFRSSALVHKWITFFAGMEASDESVFTGFAAAGTGRL